MSNITGTSPLNARQLQGLLRGSQRSLVSIQVFGEHICSIERGLAQHFSPIWRQRLANAAVKIVHVGFPANAPAGSSENSPLGNLPPAVPLSDTPATFQGNAPSGETYFRSPKRQTGNIFGQRTFRKQKNPIPTLSFEHKLTTFLGNAPSGNVQIRSPKKRTGNTFRQQAFRESQTLSQTRFPGEQTNNIFRQHPLR